LLLLIYDFHHLLLPPNPPFSTIPTLGSGRKRGVDTRYDDGIIMLFYPPRRDTMETTEKRADVTDSVKD
jgi:hypothetical protein